ncbi:hypothetical protein FUA23_14990 [Neolewinella aurantiaca]|uniref:Cytochrome c domain-containing protein n=1 Tax=Neolewinella aurantiaca TaxID=2602767 RepID=A0A5C7FM18_9BACT|nr:hypothetical protein [Neolewinella aurantiaca]TXF88439.1 hypothetical protein FUA23_14990 [Neolewinella aurantiaca]
MSRFLLVLLPLVALITLAADLPPADPFDTMMDVVTHKRCMNCHPSGNKPRQGEDSHLHYFNVQRGPDDHGVAAVQCGTCHQSKNNDYSGVPGAPHWGLAPLSMAWEGLSRAEIARVILDPEKNGGKNLEEIVKHMTEDELVLWAFEPGVDNEGIAREKPPVSEADFKAAVKAWAANGAPIPND